MAPSWRAGGVMAERAGDSSGVSAVDTVVCGCGALFAGEHATSMTKNFFTGSVTRELRNRFHAFVREPEIRVVSTRLMMHSGFRTSRMTMWNLADRVVKAVSDVTVGTVIVLFHVALADRDRKATRDPKARKQQQHLPA
jgi:hypothetical protein